MHFPPTKSFFSLLLDITVLKTVIWKKKSSEERHFTASKVFFRASQSENSIAITQKAKISKICKTISFLKFNIYFYEQRKNKFSHFCFFFFSSSHSLVSPVLIWFFLVSSVHLIKHRFLLKSIAQPH